MTARYPIRYGRNHEVKVTNLILFILKFLFVSSIIIWVIKLLWNKQGKEQLRNGPVLARSTVVII